MPKLRFKTKVKLGAGAGTLMMLALPIAAHASTTATAPLATPTSSVSTTTNTLSTATGTTSLTAPVTSVLAPKAAGTTTVVTVPAPASTADAYAAKVDGLLAISHTHATASGSGTSSTADPLELGGPTPPASQFGGTQNGPGSTSSALLDTAPYAPANQFRLALTPWAVSNTQNTASAVSDIVLLDLGDQTTAQSASVRVLQSTSNAAWNPSASSANASSDGAIVKAGGPGGLDIDLLHAETNSSGTGHSYLLSINGNEIGSSDQVNGQCTLTIPGLLSLDCLTATGGVANNVISQAAGVVNVTLGGTPAGLHVGLIQSTSNAGTPATPAVSSGNGGQQNGGGNNGSGGSGSQAAKAGTGSLAFTGSNAFELLLAALLLGLIGSALVLATRRFRPTNA